jgi:hypothetical protein
VLSLQGKMKLKTTSRIATITTEVELSPVGMYKLKEIAKVDR